MTNAEKNSKYLNEIATGAMRTSVLAGIAKHYGTNVAAIEDELFNGEPLLAYEYMVDKALRNEVYATMQSIK